MSDKSSNDHEAVLLIGGPDAGKSNFLFRLWIAIDTGQGALVKDGLPSELDYLSGGAAGLLEGKFAGHTSKEVYERVFVPVKTRVPGDSRGGTLVVPDLDGEQILTICRNRRWSTVWEDLLSNRCACLLFVRASSEAIVAPLDWATCFAKYGGAIEAPKTERGEVAKAVGSAGSDGSQADEDESVQLPTQVVLTEWLQFLRQAFTSVAGGSFRPRIGVVISAWDAVPNDQQPAGPVEYLADNFPMLHQFIQAHDEAFEFQVFGVTVVAGDLKNDEDFKNTYLEGNPPDFGFVLHSLSGQLERSPDITLPIAWALRVLPDAS